VARIVAPIDTDPNNLLVDAVTYLQTIYPGYQPSEGNLEWVMLSIIAQMAADVRDVASDVPDLIFSYFGQSLLNIAQLPAASATFAMTFTAIDTIGHTVPAGTNVAVRKDNGDLIGFQTVNDAVILAGGATSDPVSVLAVVPGVDGNGLAVTTTSLQLVDSLAYIASVAPDPSPTVSIGGQDPESSDDYLGRLRDELSLLTPRPILPRDFAILSASQNYVYRATALDGYNPLDDTFNNEKMVAVAAQGFDGLTLSGPNKILLAALLEANREVNFVVNIMDPTYTTVSVAATIAILPGWDPTDVCDRCEASITAYLSPITWGQDDSTDRLDWRIETVVRLNKLIQVIENTPGCDYVIPASLTINAVAADLTLSGRVPLPNPGTMSVVPTV
jgi:baseplate J-like protein